MDLKKSKIDSDLYLVTGLKNKDERAFTILVNRYKGPLFYVIYRIVGNTLDAEDLTMITFVKVFTGIESYVPDYLFRTWLFRIARNTSIDFLKLKNHKIYGNESLDDRIASNTLNPEQILIGKENVKILKYKIKNSNPKFREIIILRSMFGYTFREIEQTCGLSISVGVQHTRRSRIFFRETLNH